MFWAVYIPAVYHHLNLDVTKFAGALKSLAWAIPLHRLQNDTFMYVKNNIQQ